jgi:hypothetical protein
MSTRPPPEARQRRSPASPKCRTAPPTRQRRPVAPVVVDRSTFGGTSAANQFSDSAMASGSGSRVGSSRQQQFSLPHTATRTPESTVQPHPAQRTCTNPIISARTVNLPPSVPAPRLAVGDRCGGSSHRREDQSTLRLAAESMARAVKMTRLRLASGGIPNRPGRVSTKGGKMVQSWQSAPCPQPRNQQVSE